MSFAYAPSDCIESAGSYAATSMYRMHTIAAIWCRTRQLRRRGIAPNFGKLQRTCLQVAALWGLLVVHKSQSLSACMLARESSVRG